jgi:hypothetical protein
MLSVRSLLNTVNSELRGLAISAILCIDILWDSLGRAGGEGGHCATSRKFAGSRSDEVNEFFSIYLRLPAALGPGDYSASNRNEFLASRARSVRKADNLAAICEPIV